MNKFAKHLAIGVALVFAALIWLDAARPSSMAAENNSSSQRSRTAAVIWNKECASCHGKDGRAKTFKAKFNGAKDLTKPSWQESTSDEHIFNVIVNGHEKMPAFGKKLSQAEIESLVAYVRHLKG